MAKEVSITKRLKISKAQQNMLGAVLVSSMILGVCLVLAFYLVEYIGFNATVIGEKDAAVTGYSETIRKLGVCDKPNGKIYSDTELQHCNPNKVKAEDVADSLRYDVLVNMAQNESLESVARESVGECYNSITGEKYDYEYWNKKYNRAKTEDSRKYYIQIIGLCSALRAIPDALPASKNELALMASLDKIFEISKWTPEALSPGGDTESKIEGLGAIELTLSVEANGEITLNALNNIEKSVRDFEINSATIEWIGDQQLNLDARATAFYTEVQGLNELTETVKGDGTITKQTLGEGEE